MMLTEYCLKEVVLHDTSDDAWVVMFNYVFNITSLLDKDPYLTGTIINRLIQDLGYADDLNIVCWSRNAIEEAFLAFDAACRIVGLVHPGGIEVLLENIGRDASFVFLGGGHESVPMSSLKEYLIGVLPENEHLHLPYDDWTERVLQIQRLLD